MCLEQAIKEDGASRDDAIAQLRSILLRGLSKSLHNRYGKPFNAEDIVQEALMKVLSSLNMFEGRSKFTTWAMTIATIGCDGCLELMDQFAQAELDHTFMPDAMEAVRVHLEQCKCCKDEYEALMIALREVQ